MASPSVRGPFTNFITTLRGLLKDAAFRAAFSILVAMLAVGTIFYSIVEGWSLLDSFYFTVITAATIGYGDFAPKTDLGKLFTIAYALISVGLLVLILGRVAKGMVELQIAEMQQTGSQRRRHSQRGRRSVRSEGGTVDEPAQDRAIDDPTG
jgi:voltage-gated potassium channel